MGMAAFLITACDSGVMDAPMIDAPMEDVFAPVTASAGVGTITRFSAQADDVIPQGAEIERLTEDMFSWSEGPVWVSDENGSGALYFTDVPQAKIYSYTDDAGLSVFVDKSGYTGEPNPVFGTEGANGLILGPKTEAGELTLIYGDHGTRRLMQLNLSDKSRAALSDNFEGRRFNSPNDVVAHSSGALYFTDPPYGLKGLNDNPTKELPFSGVYRRAPDGTLSIIDRSLTFPNGVILSPDEQTLFVAVSDPKAAKLYRYDLNEAGLPAARSDMFDFTSMTEEAPGLPDGMAISQTGYLFVTGPGGVHVFSPEGMRIALISTGTAAANCTFGGVNGDELYITSGPFLARVKLSVTGLGL